MTRIAIAATLLAVSLTAAPAWAVDKSAKMETCRFGADSQNLQGAERKKFIDRCMSDRDDPRGPAAPKTQQGCRCGWADRTAWLT